MAGTDRINWMLQKTPGAKPSLSIFAEKVRIQIYEAREEQYVSFSARSQRLSRLMKSPCVFFPHWSTAIVAIPMSLTMAITHFPGVRAMQTCSLSSKKSISHDDRQFESNGEKIHFERIDGERSAEEHLPCTSLPSVKSHRGNQIGVCAMFVKRTFEKKRTTE